jgi:fermentation-respiration switch protein FrsA (DUF1100 family)
VEFVVDGSVKLRGWLFVPPGEGRRPAITMAHGYAGVKEHALEPFARAFAKAGFVVLLHDRRGFGASEGTPRHDIDPWRQIAEWRRAISFLESLHRPITTETGPVRAEGKVISIGKRIAFTEARLTDMSGRLYASATSTFLVLPQ